MNRRKKRFGQLLSTNIPKDAKENKTRTAEPLLMSRFAAIERRKRYKSLRTDQIPGEYYKQRGGSCD